MDDGTSSTRSPGSTGGNRRIRHGDGFVEVGDRCWVARYEEYDVNVGVVAGERGLLVVDTQASEPLARVVLDDVRRLGAGDVVAVLNTHAHFDHAFGNAVFADAYDGLQLLAHEDAAAELRATAPAVQAIAAQDPDPRRADLATARIVVPQDTFSSARVVDLGDRMVELVHPGRGHTGGDAVVRVPDADVLFAGDLVEESGAPAYGDDCYPLDWPVTLDLLLSMVGDGSVVVPGHGLPVDKRFVLEQRADIGVVAETVRDLAGHGVPPAEMGGAAQWPYPPERLAYAFARAVAQLPRSARSLPLI